MFIYLPIFPLAVALFDIHTTYSDVKTWCEMVEKLIDVKSSNALGSALSRINKVFIDIKLNSLNEILIVD